MCHLQHKLIGFYNQDEKSLQRGTDWGFKYSGLSFGFKGLTYLFLRIIFSILGVTKEVAASSAVCFTRNVFCPVA
jgi:hypothetical protein